MTPSPPFPLSDTEALAFFCHFSMPLVATQVDPRIPFGLYTDAMWRNLCVRVVLASCMSGDEVDFLARLGKLSEPIRENESGRVRLRFSAWWGDGGALALDFGLTGTSVAYRSSCPSRGLKEMSGELDISANPDTGDSPAIRLSDLLCGAMNRSNLAAIDSGVLLYECDGLGLTLRLRKAAGPGQMTFAMPDGREFTFDGRRFAAADGCPAGPDLIYRHDPGEAARWTQLRKTGYRI